MTMWRQRLFTTILCLSAAIFLSACTFGKGKAGLQVLSADIPSSVYINGELLDKTPLINKDLKPGDYVLSIKPDNAQLASYETNINLKKGLLTVVTWKPGSKPETSGGVIYEMEPTSVRGTSQLSLISIPDRAIVSIDGAEKDFAPLLVENISPGHHEFEVSLPSFETQKHTINVLENYRMLVTVKLAKQEDTVPAAAAMQEPEPSPPVASTSAQPSPTPKVATTPTATPSASASPSTTNVPKPRILILPTNFFVEGKEVLRVRDAVGSGGKELGFAPVGNRYPFLSQSSNWYQITFNGVAAWVSGQYAQLEQ